MTTSYWLYMLKCADGSLYTGITTDLARRVKEHNETKRGAAYTRARRPVELVYSQQHPTRSAALKAEVRLKKLSHVEKLALIVSS